MASSVDVKFEDICRTCMGCSQENPTDETFKLQSIFDYVDDRCENKRVQICDILNLAVHQLPKIDAMDELPLNICLHCLEKLYACYEFQIGCINADRRLRCLIQNAESPPNPLRSDMDSIQSFIKQEFILPDRYEVNNVIQPKDETTNYDTDSGSHELQTDFTEEMEIESKVDISESSDSLRKQANSTQNQKGSTRVWICKACSQCFSNKRLMVKHIENDQTECKAYVSKEMSKQIVNPEEDKLCSTTVNAEVWGTKNPNNTWESITGLETSQNLEKSSKQIVNSVENELGVTTANAIETYSNILETINLTGPKESTTELQPTENVDKSNLPNIDTWICKICESVFLYKRSLRRHMLLVHDEVSPKYVSLEDVIEKNKQKSFTGKCNECGEVFKSLALFRLHKFKHKDPLPYKCKYCKKGFKRKLYLEKHESMHNQEQLPGANVKESYTKYSPPTASMSYPLQLQRSQMETVVFKDYEPLEVLGQSQDQLEEQDNLFICSRCRKEFNDINSLRLHAQLHESEKRFDCLFCSKSFRTYSSMYSHQRRIHKDLM